MKRLIKWIIGKDLQKKYKQIIRKGHHKRKLFTKLLIKLSLQLSNEGVVIGKGYQENYPWKGN